MILIIDDEKDICFLLGMILKQKTNENSRFVNSLSEAKKALAEDHPSLVFLDNHLPDGLGVNYVGYIKEKYPETKIIMISAHDTAADKKLAITRGADAFIGKPFNRAEIYNTVDQVLNLN